MVVAHPAISKHLINIDKLNFSMLLLYSLEQLDMTRLEIVSGLVSHSNARTNTQRSKKAAGAKPSGSLILSKAVAGCSKPRLPGGFTPLAALGTGMGLCLCNCSWERMEISITASVPSLHHQQPSSHLSSKDLSCLPSAIAKWKS